MNTRTLRLPNVLLPVVLGIFSGAFELNAQVEGAITGSVRDPAGLAASAARLRILNADSGAERSLETDAEGLYHAAGLAPGVYEVRVVKDGFRTEVRSGVELSAGRAVRVDFQLSLGKTFEVVEVAARPPLVGMNATEWGGSLEREALDNLPLNGRDLFDLSSQQPGVAVVKSANKSITNGLGTTVSVNGLRPNQNGFRLDGIYINDATAMAPSSAAGRLLGTEAIHELYLVANPFSAEYGRSAGGILTAVSKSGGNEWHGSLYEFLRNSALDSRNFFDAAAPAPLRKNQFGALTSGPVRRNRAFFLANYEAVRQTVSQTERSVTLTSEARQGRLPRAGGIVTVPVAPVIKPYLDLYPLPNGTDYGDGTAEFIVQSSRPTREDYATGKFDFHASDRLRLSSRYTFDDAQNDMPDPFHIWVFTSDSRYQFAQAEAQYVHSPNTIHALRAGFSRVRNEETSRMSRDVPASLSFMPGQILGSIRTVGLSDFGGTQEINVRVRPRRHIVNSTQVNYDLTHIRGRHVLRAGGGYDRIQFNQRSDVMGVGNYRFNSISDLLQAKPRNGELMAPGSDSIRGWRFHRFHGFIQDEVRVNRRLSVSAGVRWEPSTAPTEVDGKVAAFPDPLHDKAPTIVRALFENPSWTNFAPRAGVAFDPSGSGKTAIRAGAGLFYDLLGTRELIIAGVRVPPFFQRLLVSQPLFPDLLAAAAKATPNVSLDGMDYRPNQPYAAQFRLTIQRELDSRTVAEIGYAGSRGIHLPAQLGEINTAPPAYQPDGRIFFAAGSPRINTAFDRMKWRRMLFNSTYQSMLLSLQRKMGRSLRIQAKYTWGKSIDEASSVVNEDFIASDQVPNPYNYRANRGLSDFDLRHSFSANASFVLPRPGGAAGRILGGWEFHGLMLAQTGHPFSPSVGFDRARISPGGDDLMQRPDVVPGFQGDLVLGDPMRYFDPLAYSLPAAGYLGNLGRGTLSGPGVFVLDLALHKVLWQRERHNLRLRVEGFNATNHTNFQIPSGRALFNSDLQRIGSAGRITATSTTARQVQLAMKYEF